MASLSLIVCVYNTDPAYLREALSSVRNSTLSECELCMVDDGSTVDYSDLIAEFDLRVLRKENGGILAARLDGIEMATGDYVGFLDSDDTVSLFYHRPMLEKAIETGADIVLGDWAFHTASTRYVCRRDSTVSQELDLSGEEVFAAYTGQAGREQAYYVLWNKLYRRELLLAAAREIRASGLPIGEISYGEDSLINFFAFRAATLLCNVHTGYYFYRIHEGQSVQVTSRERLERQIRSMGGILQVMREHTPEQARTVDLIQWQALMSRTHYSHARAQKYTELYPLIREQYGVETLKPSTWHDSSVYYRAALLPVNFPELDTALRPLFDREGKIMVRYDRREPYVARIVALLGTAGVEVQYDRSAALRIPRGVRRPIDRILHNDLVYAVGVLLFKKGSRLRAWLKRIL